MIEPSVAVTLQKLPLFNALNATEAHQLADLVKVEQFAAGESLLEQGKISASLWVLLEGTCEVLKHFDDHWQEKVVLAELEPCSYFGEMSFFSPAPHSASVRAKTDVKALRLERRDYDDLVRDGVWVAHKIAQHVLQGMADRLRHMDEWVAKLATHHEETDGQAQTTEERKRPEWMVFREKLFNGWNL